MYQPEPSKSSNAPFSAPIKIIALCWMLFMNKIDDSFTGSIYWHFVFLAHEKSHSVVFGRKCLSLCVYCSCHGEIPTPLIKSNTSTLTVCINDFLLNPMQPKVKRNIQAFKTFALCFPNTDSWGYGRAKENPSTRHRFTLIIWYLESCTWAISVQLLLAISSVVSKLALLCSREPNCSFKYTQVVLQWSARNPRPGCSPANELTLLWNSILWNGSDGRFWLLH